MAQTDPGEGVEALYTEFLALNSQEGMRFEEFLLLYPDREMSLRRLHSKMRMTAATLGQDDPSIDFGYEILEPLGAGGIGEVYRARDKVLEREVAIKVLRTSAKSVYKHRERFLREARALARIQHPNVLAIQNVEELDGEIRLVMELIRGRTLQQIVQADGPLSPREAAEVAIDLTRALGAMHQAGLVHMDVKPGNIMRERGGRTVLLDFGLVRSPDLDDQALGGTPPFMAPEHFGRGVPGAHTDIYGLGVTLYWLLSARLPISASEIGELRRQVLEGHATPLLDVRPSLDRSIVAIVEKSMRPDAEDRFESMGYFERALREYLAEGPTAESPSHASPRSRTRRYWLAGAGGLAVLCALPFLFSQSSATEPFEFRAKLIRHERAGGRIELGGSAGIRVRDALSLEVWSNKPCFLYLFNEDDEKHSFTLYPPATIHRPILPNEWQFFPRHPEDEGRWTVDTSASTEHYFLIASIEEDALGEFLRKVIQRPRSAESSPFKLEDLDHASLSEVKQRARGTGVEDSVEDQPLPGSIGDLFDDYEAYASDEPSVVVQRWEVPHIR